LANIIRVIGIGPGNPDYITPLAAEMIRQSDILAGGERVLELFSSLGKEMFVVKNNLNEMIDYIKMHRENNKVAVLASGDPSFYGILEYMKRHFSSEELQVVPGLSSIQLACAKLCISWHDAVFYSVHGRETDGLIELVRSNPKVIVLTDPKKTPAVIAEGLRTAGIKDKTICVCEHLSYPDERIGRYSIEEVPDDVGKSGCVLVISGE
jgi:cobalt-precorrin-7 (C5)-methyltransferase